MTYNITIDCEPLYTYTSNSGNEYLVIDFQQFGANYAVFKNGDFVTVTDYLSDVEYMCDTDSHNEERVFCYDDLEGWGEYYI